MRKRIAVIGGGTGTFAVLSGLKRYPVDLAAIVTMADDGGSTGILRDELGVLPPGDVRQCLVALARSDRLMRELMNYRFSAGGLAGHNFGNLLLSALEKVTGSFEAAVAKAGELLRIEGRVIPSTLQSVRLVAEFKDGRVVRGERVIQRTPLAGLTHFVLEPASRANPAAVAAIRAAHLIVVGPGDFYSSLVPNFLVSGIPEAVRASRAKKAYVVNLMTKAGHTESWAVDEFVQTLEQYIGARFDHVIWNNCAPSPELVQKYAREGERPVRAPVNGGKRFIGIPIVSRRFAVRRKGDPLKRTLIRHDPDQLARSLLALIRG